MQRVAHPAVLAIDVYRDGQPIVRASGDKFALPDGRPGAKWGGLVFPLHDGNRIETTDIGTPPAACRPWVDPVSSWRFENGGPGADAYVFVDGDDAARQRAIRSLTAAGASVLRSGPNLSGTDGDWFIRIAAPAAPVAAAIEALLGAAESPAATPASPIRERLLAEALDASLHAGERLRTELAAATAQASDAAKSAEAVAALQQNLAAMMSRLAETAAEAQHLRQQVTASRRQATGAGRLEQALVVMAAATLPRLTFMRGSMDFIAVELSDQTAIWTILAALDRQERGRPAGWKLLSGLQGWWERHFPNGQDDQGRVYAKLNPDGGKWQVLVSHKQSQSGDIRRLD